VSARDEQHSTYFTLYPEVASAARHNVLFRSIRESKRMCVDVLDAAVASLPAPQDVTQDGSSSEDALSATEDVTQVLGVFDLRGLSPACVDFEFITFLIDTVYKYYPQRLGQVLLVSPPPFVFEAAWEVIRPQLGRHADIVRFVTLSELRKDYFTPATLPHDFR